MVGEIACELLACLGADHVVLTVLVEVDELEERAGGWLFEYFRRRTTGELLREKLLEVLHVERGTQVLRDGVTGAAEEAARHVVSAVWKDGVLGERYQARVLDDEHLLTKRFELLIGLGVKRLQRLKGGGFDHGESLGAGV